MHTRNVLEHAKSFVVTKHTTAAPKTRRTGKRDSGCHTNVLLKSLASSITYTSYVISAFENIFTEEKKIKKSSIIDE